ncbi:DUF6221 family protein [Streptomyces sp. NPDC004610]|uniref:DUF6221 family protein n=1 Tax=unclassified Streptomyces TaxID=2593676 RepID=UPI0033AED87E
MNTPGDPTPELAHWLSARLDEDEHTARAASRRHGEPGPPGGVRWRWEDPETDETVVPDLDRGEYVGGDTEVDGGDLGEGVVVALRSAETWPTRHFGELPQFGIDLAQNVDAAVGAHIVRHDPARVLAETDAKRRVLAWALTAPPSPSRDHVLRLLALPYADRPGYREKWRP